MNLNEEIKKHDSIFLSNTMTSQYLATNGAHYTRQEEYRNVPNDTTKILSKFNILRAVKIEKDGQESSNSQSMPLTWNVSNTSSFI